MELNRPGIDGRLDPTAGLRSCLESASLAARLACSPYEPSINPRTIQLNSLNDFVSQRQEAVAELESPIDGTKF